MKNLTLRNITKACHGEYRGPENLLGKEVAGVTIDSRKVEKDYLFIAIDGERVNAHKFIPDTIEKGAMCVISHEDLGETDFPYILVESTGQALLDTAKLYRDSFDIKVVAVLEMGVNHFGEMRRLSSVASPDICVITNIGIAHLEFFKTREGILQEKSQMIQDMKTGGSILLNGDDDLLRDMGPVKGVDPEFFGLGKNCQFYATDVESLGLRGSSCTIHLPSGESFDCIVPLPGAHMVQNALAGTAVGYQLGLTPAEIKAGIEGLPSIPGRNNIIQTDKIIILDDCYNANPISMQASLDVLNMAIGRKVAVLGDMGELGETGKELHYETGAHAGDIGIDLVCGIGELSKELVAGASEHGCEAKWFPAKADFLAEMKHLIQPGDNILVKASHGMQFPEIVDELQKF